MIWPKGAQSLQNICVLATKEQRPVLSRHVQQFTLQGWFVCVAQTWTAPSGMSSCSSLNNQSVFQQVSPAQREKLQATVITSGTQPDDNRMAVQNKKGRPELHCTNPGSLDRFA